MIDESTYNSRLEKLFVRFPSVQNVGFNDAYKPGLAHMEMFCERLGNPEKQFKSIHVAGTNGKGSVSNMLASAIAAKGFKVGLYTSPHIIDFRERMRVIDGRSNAQSAELISKEDVWEFITSKEQDFDKLNLSFFEITTGMAFWWFKKQKVDVAVIEVGLGGRLDSTNVIMPEAAVVTSIGLDHCAMLGNTRALIATEKAGIFKDGVPAIVGSRDDETSEAFESKAAETGSTLIFANEYEPVLWNRNAELLAAMDLQGDYQEPNLRTALTTLELLGYGADDAIANAIIHTAERMDFHGRWEKIAHSPDMICDIGHNPPALKQNFAQLEKYLREGTYGHLVIVYGVMADKDLDGIMPLMPEDADYILVAPDTARAMKVELLFEKMEQYWTASGRGTERLKKAKSVAEGIAEAKKIAQNYENTLIYIGGSTFVVTEAITI